MMPALSFPTGGQWASVVAAKPLIWGEGFSPQWRERCLEAEALQQNGVPVFTMISPLGAGISYAGPDSWKVGRTAA